MGNIRMFRWVGLKPFEELRNSVGGDQLVKFFSEESRLAEADAGRAGVNVKIRPFYNACLCISRYHSLESLVASS